MNNGSKMELVGRKENAVPVVRPGTTKEVDMKRRVRIEIKMRDTDRVVELSAYTRGDAEAILEEARNLLDRWPDPDEVDDAEPDE